MNTSETLSPNECVVPTPENLTAILTCLGARTSAVDRNMILNFQNPYRQKRGGLGFGAYSIVDLPGGGKSFSNINIYNRQAQTSPLELVICDSRRGLFELIIRDKNDQSENCVTSGRLLPIPSWGSKVLSTGKPAISVLQQHGPVNLVGILGSPSCSLFEEGKGCEFCMMNGGTENVDRSVDEILEAFALAKQDKAAYNITLTTSMITSDAQIQKIIEDVARLKKGLGCDTGLALETVPFRQNSAAIFRALKDAGLDTFLMPLEMYNADAQRRYLPGKADLLQDMYWQNAAEAREVFGFGNVTSSIIVGLEPLNATLEGVRRMLDAGVIPEPIPVRWDDSKLTAGAVRPLTNPNDLVAVRGAIMTYIEQQGIADTISKTRAGCAACGGCGGIVVDRVSRIGVPIR